MVKENKFKQKKLKINALEKVFAEIELLVENLSNEKDNFYREKKFIVCDENFNNEIDFLNYQQSILKSILENLETFITI